MAIDIDGHVDRGVAQLLFHIGETFSLLDEKTRKAMPEEMEVTLYQAGFCEQARKDFPNFRIVHRLARLILEEPHVWQLVNGETESQELFFSVENHVTKQAPKLTAHIHLAGKSGLGQTQNAFDDISLDIDQTIHEIEIADLECERFADPNAGSRQQEKKRQIVRRIFLRSFQ